MTSNDVLRTFAAALIVTPVAYGAYQIYNRLPGYLEDTPWTDFPYVSSLIAIIAFLSVLHLAEKLAWYFAGQKK